ncbi:MAG: helix-turn-helix domain-containing protein [Flavobacterium sp.]
MSDILDINLLSDKAILKKIGLFIQQTRIKQNLTQEELATQAAISRSTLSAVERGDNSSINNLIKILRILNVLYVLNTFDIVQELSPMQLAKGEKQQRKRASKTDQYNLDNTDLGW